MPQYDEQDLEDKVLLINPIGETSKVFVFHQAAARLIRKDIVQQLKKNVKEVSHLDLEEMLAEVELHAVAVENKVIETLS